MVFHFLEVFARISLLNLDTIDKHFWYGFKGYTKGRITQPSLDIIKSAVIQFPNETPDQKEDRVQLSLYLILTSPEYLIVR